MEEETKTITNKRKSPNQKKSIEDESKKKEVEENTETSKQPITKSKRKKTEETVPENFEHKKHMREFLLHLLSIRCKAIVMSDKNIDIFLGNFIAQKTRSRLNYEIEQNMEPLESKVIAQIFTKNFDENGLKNKKEKSESSEHHKTHPFVIDLNLISESDFKNIKNLLNTRNDNYNSMIKEMNDYDICFAEIFSSLVKENQSKLKFMEKVYNEEIESLNLDIKEQILNQDDIKKEAERLALKKKEIQDLKNDPFMLRSENYINFSKK